MAAGFTMLLAKIAAFAQWVGLLFVAVFTAMALMGKDLVVWTMDKLGDVAVSAVQSVDTTGISTNVIGWGSLPSEVINVMGLLGVGYAVSIISTAIAVRLALQLIPFVRLGS